MYNYMPYIRQTGTKLRGKDNKNKKMEKWIILVIPKNPNNYNFHFW